MGEQINNEYEDFQKYLNEKGKKLRLLVRFELNDGIEEALEELNKKEIIF